MSAAPWTPGPWRIVPSIGGWVSVFGGEAAEVARLEWFYPKEADARLIAAAPEMAAEGEKAVEAPIAMQRIMRREDRSIADLTDPMQKLAFTFYTELVERSQAWDALLARIRGETP